MTESQADIVDENAGDDHANDEQIEDHQEHIHVVPGWLLLTVFAVLLFLTFVTVAVTWIDFGRTGNVWIALTIASIKAALVALYFMHLRWDSPFNSVILIAAMFFVALLIGIIVLDTSEYNINFSAPPPTSARPTQ
ncbi:MAG: cytochrome c oxidase subunit [Phycisphaerales bacterium]|jgi:cytochrome c oxidase subunit 4|nr:cytochrome c oxidase subunit [Phycisphaerales bacterium]MEA2735678.1 cytochrome c oxidase subunit [Humisphaera sp.]